MNTLPIAGIKAQLKTMYPGYRFNIIAVPATYSYSVTVFKNRNSLDTKVFGAETPITTFWDQLKDWMRPIIRKNGA